MGLASAGPILLHLTNLIKYCIIEYTNLKQEKPMRVTLPSVNKYVINKLYTAARTCYSDEAPEVIFEKSLTMDKEDMLKTIMHTVRSGHFSVIEHEHITFFISGVSRALTHQLIRHRLANYSQQSQRYCKLKEDEQFEYVTPHTVKNDEDTAQIYQDFMEFSHTIYNSLIKSGVPAEDARYVLPNAACTNITVTMNLRQLKHFFNERLCTCAQWEIRELANKMRLHVQNIVPGLEEYFVPKCEELGYCTESKKRSCGRKKLKADVLGS